MIEIKITNVSVARVIEIVEELRSQGWIQGKDFEFSYHPTSYPDGSYSSMLKKHVIFKFYFDKLATMFTLKYGHE